MSDAPTPANEPKSGPSTTVKIGALLVIGLMLLSGVAIFFAGQNAGTDPNTDPNAPALKSFHADDVQGQVTQVFATAVVGAQTAETDKSILDEALLDVPGVQAVDSQFTKLSPTDAKLTYVANVSLAEGFDKDVFVDGVLSIIEIETPEIYFQAAISVSPTLVVKDENNKDTTITLPNSIIQAIVSPETQVGNTISGQLVATYQGEQLVSAYILESQNISLSPTPISIEGTYTLSALEPQLAIAGSFNYWFGFDENVLVTGLANVNGITSVGPPLVPSIGKTITITVDNADLMMQDFNAFIAAHADHYTSVTLTADGFVVGLGNVTLEQAQDELTMGITEAAAANVPVSFTNPLTQFLVDVNVSAGSTANVESAIQSYFANWPVDVNVELFQNGQVDATTLFVADLNQSVMVPNGVIPVSVQPGHSIGDAIVIQINGIVVSNELVYVNGLEPTLTT